MNNLKQLVTGILQLRAAILIVVVMCALVALSACGGDSASVPTVTTEAGPSPFISLVHVSGVDLSGLAAVDYTIAAKPGSVSKAVHVRYTASALAARGYTANGTLTVPVFGLYAGYDNQVSIELTRETGETSQLEDDIQTTDYTDPTGIYAHPNIVTKRAPGSTLGFDFIYIKSSLGSPIILDTDGEIRWAAPAGTASTSSTLVGDTFIIGNPGTPTVYRLRLDGNLVQGDLPADGYTDFNHDIDHGKLGVLAEVDTVSNGIANLASTVIEIHDRISPTVLNNFDLGSILSAYMTSQGDDGTAFVRPGVDWFHNNSAIYDPRDDSVIVSSRENFVIKLDYRTHAIEWILGDPTKYWYTFPSLRAKALTVAAGGLYPVGQHGLSITSDGLLMLFNDGLGSLNQPAGQPAGISRSYSAVSRYSIDPSTMTAQEVWRYDAGQMIYSAVCSSAYEAQQSLLVDYAYASGGTEALLVGLDANQNVAFEFEYPTTACNTSWNARPIPLDDLKIQQ